MIADGVDAAAQLRHVFEERKLPAGFKLAPLRILADEDPAYFAVVNMYQSSGGLVSGARTEWSVFVEGPGTGAPRFLALEAVAANDFVFWGNAVADRCVFNGTVYARDAEMIAAEDVRIEDQSRWARIWRCCHGIRLQHLSNSSH